MNRIVQYTPEDMTVTVEAGVTLAALQTELARHGQWLPLDPPQPDALTIGGLIDQNPSGPRRLAHGTIRDHLLGIKVTLAEGTIINSGGKVVKNVAGYDLAKLFVGARGSLGIVAEATFKLRPLPELERFISASCNTFEQANEVIEAVVKSELTPVALDLHNLKDEENANHSVSFTIVAGFAGSREEVEFQLALAEKLGFDQSGSLNHEAVFWNNSTPTNHLSVLPSKLMDAVRSLNGAEFVARAGNGIIYHRGPASPRADKLPVQLMQRVKDAFDPQHLLPALPS